MLKTKRNILFFCLLLTHIAHGIGKNEIKKSNNLIITLSAGPAWESAGQKQTFYLQPSIENTYAANHNIQTIFNGEIFVGSQHNLHEDYQGQLGLAVAGISKVSMTGQIWNDADPMFNNFNYAYTLQNTRVALKAQLLKDCKFYKIQPYLNLSLGISFNHAYNYRSLPLLYEALPAPNFTPHTSASFSYTLGVGIQRELNKNLSAGVGYEFADWGYHRLGLAPNQSLGHGLISNNFYTNSLLFNLIYVM